MSLIVRGVHRRTGAYVIAEAPTGDRKLWMWELRLRDGRFVARGTAVFEMGMQRAVSRAIKEGICNTRTKAGLRQIDAGCAGMGLPIHQA